MSGKIKSKDLQYDSTLPPFLQRLHDQNAGRGDSDRHERPIARPKRARDPDEDDDGPTVVDESGETVSKDDLEQLTKPGTESASVSEDVGGSISGDVHTDAAPKASGALPVNGESHALRKVTDGLTTKKRKAAKVVGDDQAKDEGAESAEKGKSSSSRGGKAPAKTKKKPKAVKLAFNDDDG
ncbi:hypothetical protein BAUCODRAFT_146546 [Baudoinia panamericana UAMH 10762]|uniref:DUF4604 domain-containing protein n=1 Tax=Baudoinia panamericana (strain UAMH 10762) TaxID=717646 RepID=M2NG29_BAUPA|nr:uncharacterized protein BAUCODRAFT_146546 [Baudoinia panamericana UAMH 10762]EMC97945.1 hypothetical protein BAUCODRAFT_146546 [Baudoinia panamericana UAMH 10762]